MQQFSTIILFLAVFGISACKVTQSAREVITYTDDNVMGNGHPMQFNLIKGDGFNYPTYAIWIENMDGDYIKTLYITKSFASGIFGHEMVGDTVWLKTSGASYQPAALPYWTHKKGLINGKQLIPTPNHPFVDAYTGATVQGDFQFNTSTENMKEPFRILLEVNQPWDWNKYWTNGKYPNNEAYKHSAQPSMVYAVTIAKNQSQFYLNPVGHGDPKGESGKLYTNLTTMTSAKEIFKYVSVELKH
jgi:hypothetical protein